MIDKLHDFDAKWSLNIDLYNHYKKVLKTNLVPVQKRVIEKVNLSKEKQDELIKISKELSKLSLYILSFFC